MSRQKKIMPDARREVSITFALGSKLAHSLAKLLRAAHQQPAAKLQPVKVAEKSDSYWRRYY
jgi:hypothetical protein